MPPLLQTAPPVIAFSKNTLWLKILSNDFLAGVPAFAVNTLTFTAPVAADTVFNLSWTDGAATMTAKNVPDSSGLQFPAGDGSWAYVQSLVEWFEGNYFISRDFDVTADNTGNPKLVFTSKIKGPKFNLTIGGAIANPTPGVSDATKENFRHHLEIWIADAAGNYQQAYTANIPLDSPIAGLTSVDIHEQLHAFLKSDYPALNALVEQCMNSIRPYLVKYAAFYGADPVVQRLYKSTGYFITKGGLNTQAAAAGDIITHLAPIVGDQASVRCLRLGSNNKLVLRDQPEWLTWINLTGTLVNIQLEVQVFNDDETNILFTSGDPVPAGAYTKHQFQCGFTQLGIAGRQGALKRPLYYTARVKGPDGYLSTQYAFVIDYNFHEWPRYFVYENSLGGFQTLCTVGKGQAEFDRNKDDAELAVDRGTAAVAGAFLETNITFQDKYTVNCGYRRSGARAVALLRDLFSSHAIHLFDRDKLIPVGISSKNSKDGPDGSNVFAGTFEYYPKYQEEVFTEDITWTDDDINELLGEAGSAAIIPVPEPNDPGADGQTIVVEFGDGHVSYAGGLLTYTAPYWLTGRAGYRIFATQLGNYLRTAEVAYDSAAGSFTILLPDFILENGDQLIIWPFKLNPDGE